MKLKSFGAATEVTGSKHLLEVNGKRILIDCGLFQGESTRQNDKAFEEIGSVDAIILTHGHLDHSGFIPRMVRGGFKGPIFATAPTREIAKVIMEDNAKIQSFETKKANKNIVKERDKVSALYQPIHVQQSMALFHEVKWDTPFEWGGLKILFQCAGHILGASSVRIEAELQSIVFSGDLGRYNDEIMFDPSTFSEADYVVMEGTYGDRDHHHEIKPQDELEEAIDKIRKKGSTLLIPAFSVARSQNVIYYLWRLFRAKPTKKVPIYVDSNMTSLVCELYKRFRDFYRLDELTIQQMFENCQFVEHISQREKLFQEQGAKVIVTASGMLSGGRSPEYLSELGKDKSNELLLVGYQAQGTLGREFVEGSRPFWLGGFHLAQSFSSHADRGELKRWLNGIKEVRKVFLVHGEEKALSGLKSYLDQPCHIMKKGEELELSK